MLTILLVLLVVVVVCMAIRDGRPFFSDFLKVALLIITFFIVVLSNWAALSIHIGK